MAPVPVQLVETPRLLLRPFREADFDAYAAFCADAETMRYLGNGQPLARIDAWRQMAMFVGHWQLLGHGMWALEEKATGLLLGRAGSLLLPGWPDFEIGWMLGRAHWGRGYAREAARAAMDHAFVKLGRRRIISMIRPDNQRSIRVAEALGERLHGEIELLGARALVYEALAPAGQGGK